MNVSKGVLKAKMLEIFRQIEKTGEELIVTDNLKPVLRVVPFTKKRTWQEIFPENRKKSIGKEKDILSPETEFWGKHTF